MDPDSGSLYSESGKEKGRKKKDKGYAQLDRASSEEDLLVDKSSSSHKKKSKTKWKLNAEKDKKKDRRVSPSASLKRKERSNVRIKENEQSIGPLLPVFGVPLAEAVSNNRSHDGIALPVVFRLCIDYVIAHGLRTEGIYRISPPKPELEDLKQAANAGVSLKFSNPHQAAALIKMFLRELPDHILTEQYRSSFEKAAGECPCDTNLCCTCLSGDRIKALLRQLPPCNYMLLAYLFKHFKLIVDQERLNRMSIPNIGMVLLMTLDTSQRLLNIFLRNTSAKVKEATSLFDDVEIKRYVSPLRPPLERLTQDLPTSRKEIEEELEKQESLLAQLHQEVLVLREKNVDHPVKAQELWDVQTVATYLKRKLKFLKQTEEKDKSEKELVETAGPCVEMFEEKQLLAVQMELREQIAEEKRAIERLRTDIRDSERNNNNISHIQSSSEQTNTDDEIDWKSECRELENRRDFLLSEIIEEKNRIASLNAQIELMAVQKAAVETTKL